MSFEADLERYFTKVSKKLDTVAYNATVLIFSAVVFDTPIDMEKPEHMGTLKGNWIPSVAVGVSASREIRDPTGEIVIEEIKNTVQGGSRNVLSNNLIYGPVVEYGLYPSPPKKPTGRTQGGYSIQAPFGMISPNLLKWNLIVEQAVKLAT